ncbi:MAG: dihydroorotate dehydrogenase electron transfer subunit [Candidatus Omnitrophica bacterium]|jgi:dihydroorotate dehydrogenase electron transfer subunit|nr:dihydroorotate dehydrogenase electron transfer subunit [Candidatus Omnitrophota bacterium]MDD5079998.1 dihydroorotate dehydrogenase electron transfer subunit [Candidatus Omnitrophota bacterium]
MNVLQKKIKIRSNCRINGAYYRLVLDAGSLSRIARPGQFIMLRVNGPAAPLLRRPLSIHAVSGQKLEILYEALGPATKILSAMRPAQELDIIGPLGKGFDYKAKDISERRHILVCGGMGVAPLNFLAQELVSRKPLAANRLPLVLIGSRSAEHILCEKEFKKKGCVVKIATDDGSRGFHGRVTELLEKLLSTIDYRLSIIYACGPRPMLKEVSRISAKHKIPAQMSLEEHMSCGIGACLGCVVNTTEGFKRVCKEGPVFRGEEIVW